MKDKFLRFFFGQVEPFENVDFFQYQISPYLLDKSKQSMFMYLTGAIR